MFAEHVDLLEWLEQPIAAPIEPAWQPTVLTKENWPPNYRGVYAWRMKQLSIIRSNPNMLAGAKTYYAANRAEFVMHWMDTFDPRKKVGLKWVPFVLFQRQFDFWQFLDSCKNDQANGLVEKSRDMGATWECCAWSVAEWLFEEDSAIGWGSRKEQLVDKLGDPTSIFEKIRLLVRRLPKEFLPVGWNAKEHSTFMRLINPENGSIITGEAGDNIGRGGRNGVYFKDESAHYERPELIEAALGDNTNVQIDISSVNGIGNVFYRKADAAIEWHPGDVIDPSEVRKFIFDWSDHPEKTQEWYNKRKARDERNGLQHIFAQEVDRDYSAAVSNTLIPLEWIKAAIDADKKLGFPRTEGLYGAAFDPADEGEDRNALALRRGVVCLDVKEWGARDVGVSTRFVATELMPVANGIKVQYDIVGMGSSVKAEYNRLVTLDKIIAPGRIIFVPWNAGAHVVNRFDRVNANDDESPKNGELFANLKAQAWWELRMRFFRTWQAVTQGIVHDFDELISLNGDMPLIHQLVKELAQPTRDTNGALKMIVEKKPDGTKSPNLADAVVMCYFPIPDEFALAVSGTQRGS